MALWKTFAVLAGVFLLALLPGCLLDKSAEGEVPWATPADWEGTLPMMMPGANPQ